MAVITISRQAGSSGAEIAGLVCKGLDYRYFDKKILAQAAAEETHAEVDFFKFTEADFTQGGRLMNRLLAALGQSKTAAQITEWEEDPRGQRTRTVIQLDESRAIALVQSAIRFVADQDNIVIMGRGAQVILHGKSGVLHVRIVAPLENRVQRIKVQHGLRGEAARRKAEEILFQSDDASADYMRRFYDVKIDDPLLYHLVLNTDELHPEDAAQLIIQAATLVPA
jgi:cytidylate kinase